MGGSTITPRALAPALARSQLAELSPEVVAALLAGATRQSLAAGTTMHRSGDTDAHCELVLSGLARVYVTAPDGRSLTIRYCRSGSLIGVASVFHRSFAMPAGVQAVTSVDILSLRPGDVRSSCDTHPEVARAMLAELSERAMSFVREIPVGVFTTVPQRVARHLLDLATARQQGAELVAETGQRELADAVGSVREVVDRALQDLRAAGIIETRRRRIAILDPARLLDRARDAAG